MAVLNEKHITEELSPIPKFLIGVEGWEEVVCTCTYSLSTPIITVWITIKRDDVHKEGGLDSEEGAGGGYHLT